MRGTVRKRGKTWSYVFEIGKVDGKRKQKEKGGFRTKEIAEKALRDAITNFENGFIDTATSTVLEYLEDWLENFIKENRKINTYNRYKEIVKLHIKNEIGSIKLNKLRPLHIDNLITLKRKEGLSGSTLQTIYGVLNASFNRAEKLRLIQNNPCRYVDRPKREKYRADILSLEDIQILFRKLDTDKYNDYIMYLALNIELELGLRRGELAGLEWKDINFKKNIIHIRNNMVYTNNDVRLDTPKTEESERQLYISDNLKSLLKKHKKIQSENRLEYKEMYVENIFNDNLKNFVLTWEDGKYIHPNYYTIRFKKILKKYNLNTNIRFHDLRHTNATLLLQNKVDFKIIQKRLGHADISTTMDIYAHVNIDMQKEATAKISNMLANK